MTRSLSLAMIAVAFAATSASAQTAKYVLDDSKQNVVALYDLYPDSLCTPVVMEGRTVKRSFAADGITLNDFVVEEATGERSVINVDYDTVSKAGPIAFSWIRPAIQRFTRDGARASWGVRGCGAAGRVILLDSINYKNAPDWRPR